MPRLTLPEASLELGISTATLRHLISKKMIPSAKRMYGRWTVVTDGKGGMARVQAKYGPKPTTKPLEEKS